MAIPPGHKAMNVGIPEELDARARRLARDMGVPVVVLVRRALADYVERAERRRDRSGRAA